MIKLQTLIDILITDNNFREIVHQDNYFYSWETNTIFSGITYNSQSAIKGDLFFVKGQNFKKEYLDIAIKQGVTFYVSEIDYHADIPLIMVNDIKKAMSLIAMAFYNYPQKDLKIIAFTGTKGKTTAAYFTYNILNQQHTTAMFSTMNTTLDGGATHFKSALTTPESFELFKLMRNAVNNQCQYLIMEVSSQAYLLNRVYGLTFDVGIFLNISPDHISPIEHPTFEDYFYHKRQLLHNSKHLIINSQSDYFSLLSQESRKVSHEFYGKDASNKIVDSSAYSFKTSGTINAEFDIKLIGTFNQDNALAAALACHHLGISIEVIKKGIAKTVVPGRMEIYTQHNNAKIFIDYAHNGDSLEKLITEVKLHQKGNIILVIGATGDKGKSRRKDFATVINKKDNLTVILTADDPNTEDPELICREIANYLNNPPHIEIDREKAIKKALSLTHNEQDAVIIAGKGADAFQIVNGEKIPYLGDKEVALKYL